MPRLLPIVLVALALTGLVFGLREVLMSEEAKVRRALDAGLEAYDEGRVLACVERLHPDFVHTARPQVDRGLLARGLVALFEAHRDPGTGELNTRASLVPETLVIELLEDDRARALFELLIEERAGASADWQTRWHARLETTLEQGTVGWLIHRAHSTTLAGRLPR